MQTALNNLEAKLLEVIQDGIPLCERPFAQIGEQVGLTEREVLERLIELKRPPRPFIRQVSAIFDSASLGYKSTLVAAKVEPSQLEQAAAIVGQHPGVSHNYERANAYNLWYTLAVPPDSRLGLQGTVDLLHQLSGAAATRMLPTLKLFKIGVKFNLGGGDESQTDAKPRGAKLPLAGRAITDADKRIIRTLQQDLPLVAAPFEIWANQAGVTVEALLASAQAYQDIGWMRRFSAVLHHREAGFTANAMGVWAVPADQQDAFGVAAAGFQAVSHCYLRPSYPDWPFNIFTMVHATSPAACEAVLAEISAATGITNYQSLYSTRKFKKTRVQYFLDDNAAWEASHEPSIAISTR
ncbi:AsnC family transcriptional regulator [soil metagenome]